MDTLDSMTVEELERLAERASNTAKQKRDATPKEGVPYRWKGAGVSGWALVSGTQRFVLRDGSGILLYDIYPGVEAEEVGIVYEREWLDNHDEDHCSIAKLYMAAYHGDAK